MSAKLAGYLLFLTIIFVSVIQAQELKLEDVIAKHASAIGTSEKRKELTNMMLLGMSQFESTLPQRKSTGKVAIVSDSANLLFISSFASESYPFEKIGYFDGKINVPFVNSGVRSPLGDFVFEHPSLLNNGLFLGSMSLHWSLIGKDSKKARSILAGTKKIDDRKAYVVEYFPKGSSEEFKIRLFFDAETFQHIRSEYREEFAGKAPQFPGARPSTTENMGRINGYVIELTETFSDFKTFQEITLPTVSKIKYMGSSSKGTFEYGWTFQVNDVKFNQTLKDGFFNF